MENEAIHAFAIINDDAMSCCENCGEELECDSFGDMPEVCPHCGAVLDWSLWDDPYYGLDDE